jgi:hypothetical protein
MADEQGGAEEKAPEDDDKIKAREMPGLAEQKNAVPSVSLNDAAGAAAVRRFHQTPGQ